MYIYIYVTHTLYFTLTHSLTNSLSLSLSLRLQAQLEEKEADMKETISSLQHKHQTELQRVKEMLAATETTNTDLQKEVSTYILVLCVWNGTEKGCEIRFRSRME